MSLPVVPPLENFLSPSATLALLNSQFPDRMLILCRSRGGNYRGCEFKSAWWFEGEWPHRLAYLNTWFPVGGTLWGRVRRLGLVGGSMPLGMDSEVSKIPVIFSELPPPVPPPPHV